VAISQPLSNVARTRGVRVHEHASAQSVLTELALLVAYVLFLAATPFVIVALALSRLMGRRSRR
jgi:hypothetical protein